MRIISGHLKGKKLLLPPREARPTTDRVKEALFNVLTHQFQLFTRPIKVLDAFAGSGALGLEALSRGADYVYFAESHPKILPILKANLSLWETEKILLLIGDIMATKAKEPVDLIFSDPPYGMYGIDDVTNALKTWFHQKTLLVWECSKNHRPLSQILKKKDERIYGETSLSFWMQE